MALSFAVYLALSTAAAFAVIQHAVVTREQFYPAVIYLATSKFSMSVLCNFALAFIILVGKLAKALFLGQLRTNEVERVSEALKYTFPEICLSLTIFRDDLSLRVLALFVMLLFSKFFHVVIDERMNHLEGNSAAQMTRLGHLRLIALVWALFLMNALCLAVFGHVLQEQGHSVLILFAFEYILLQLELVRVSYRYVLFWIAQRMGGEWPNRSLYHLYGKLWLDLVRLCVLVMYFTILFTFYSMPIMMMRDLMRSFMDVRREMANVVRSRRLRSQVNTMFPSPTPQELATLDNTCVVCLHDVTPESAAISKKLPCSHVFHTECLLSWWERQQSCPTCRNDIYSMAAVAAATAAQAQTAANAAAAAVAALGQQAPTPAAATAAPGGTPRAALAPPAATAGTPVASPLLARRRDAGGGRSLMQVASGEPEPPGTPAPATPSHSAAAAAAMRGGRLSTQRGDPEYGAGPGLGAPGAAGPLVPSSASKRARPLEPPPPPQQPSASPSGGAGALRQHVSPTKRINLAAGAAEAGEGARSAGGRGQRRAIESLSSSSSDSHSHSQSGSDSGTDSDDEGEGEGRRLRVASPPHRTAAPSLQLGAGDAQRLLDFLSHRTDSGGRQQQRPHRLRRRGHRAGGDAEEDAEAAIRSLLAAEVQRQQMLQHQQAQQQALLAALLQQQQQPYLQQMMSPLTHAITPLAAGSPYPYAQSAPAAATAAALALPQLQAQISALRDLQAQLAVAVEAAIAAEASEANTVGGAPGAAAAAAGGMPSDPSPGPPPAPAGATATAAVAPASQAPPTPNGSGASLLPSPIPKLEGCEDDDDAGSGGGGGGEGTMGAGLALSTTATTVGQRSVGGSAALLTPSATGSGGPHATAFSFLLAQQQAQRASSPTQQQQLTSAPGPHAPSSSDGGSLSLAALPPASSPALSRLGSSGSSQGALLLAPVAVAATPEPHTQLAARQQQQQVALQHAQWQQQQLQLQHQQQLLGALGYNAPGSPGLVWPQGSLMLGMYGAGPMGHTHTYLPPQHPYPLQQLMAQQHHQQQQEALLAAMMAQHQQQQYYLPPNAPAPPSPGEIAPLMQQQAYAPHPHLLHQLHGHPHQQQQGAAVLRAHVAQLQQHQGAIEAMLAAQRR